MVRVVTHVGTGGMSKAKGRHSKRTKSIAQQLPHAAGTIARKRLVSQQQGLLQERSGGMIRTRRGRERIISRASPNLKKSAL